MVLAECVFVSCLSPCIHEVFVLVFLREGFWQSVCLTLVKPLYIYDVFFACFPQGRVLAECVFVSCLSPCIYDVFVLVFLREGFWQSVCLSPV